MAKYRVYAEDFEVQEELLYPPSGDGAQTLVLIEKRGRTTDGVARDLAASLGLRGSQVGYAGRKDRVAVTRQWFSVPGLDPAAAGAIQLDGARVLDAARNRHRLRAGELVGNAFRLVIRDLDPGELLIAVDRAAGLRRFGIANRFGPQRFGRGGLNPDLGRAVLTGLAPPGDRRDARFLVSALQSAVFNEVLDRRSRLFPEVGSETLEVPGQRAVDRLCVGDVAVDHRSGLVRPVREPADLAAEVERLEVSPSGPLFGRRAAGVDGQVASLEREVLELFEIPSPSEFRIDVAGERRALRIPTRDLEAQPQADGTLVLTFSLPSGVFATALLDAVFEGLPLSDASVAGGGEEVDAGSD